MVLRVAARHPTAAFDALSALNFVDAEVIPLDAPNWLTGALATSGVLINATPAGMGDPLASPLPIELLHICLRRRSSSIWSMRHQRRRSCGRRGRWGCARRLGLEMLLEQGAAAFQLWAGQPAPIAVMRAALAAHDAD